jgi:bacterioferritin-associated ferredoxin
MYLCVCNAITDDQVQWAVAVRGAASAEAVFRVLEARPDCQRCVGSLEEAVLAIRAGEPVRAQVGEAGATPWGCRGRCRPVWGVPAPAVGLAG